MTGHVTDSDKLSFKSPWWLFAQLRHRRNRCPLGWWKKRRRWPRPRPPRCWNCVWSWKCKGQRAATACGRDLAEPIERSAGGPLAGQTNATVGGQGKDKKKWFELQIRMWRNYYYCLCVKTYTTASGDGDLDGVSPDLADVFEVERLVGRFVLSPVNVEWSGVDRHLDAGRPIGIHGSVFVVEAFQLQLQVVSTISFLKKEKKKKWLD